MTKDVYIAEGLVEELVLKYENKLYRTAIAIMRNRADAEDIVNDVFIRIIERKPVFQSPEHELAWLIRVTVNLCKSRLRSSWWKKTVPLLDSYPANSKGEHYLMDTIDKLSSKYRIVIHLFYYEGYSTKEIAEITQQKESTVRCLLTRARQKLKMFLEEEGQ